MRKVFQFNLKTRLYSAFAISLLVPTILVGLLSFNSAQEQLKEQLLSGAEENVKLLNSNINNTIAPKIFDAEFFSKQITKDLYGNGGESAPVFIKLQQYIGLHPDVQTVYVGTSDGKMLTYPKIDLPKDFDPRSRPWYQEAEQKKVRRL